MASRTKFHFIWVVQSYCRMRKTGRSYTFYSDITKENWQKNKNSFKAKSGPWSHLSKTHRDKLCCFSLLVIHQLTTVSMIHQLTTPMLRKLFLLVLSIRSEKNWDMIILHWKAAFPIANVPCAECSYPWPTISYDAACKADFISAALYARSLWQYLFGFIFAVLSLWLYLSCSVIQSLYAGSFWRYLCGFIFVTLS